MPYSALLRTGERDVWVTTPGQPDSLLSSDLVHKRN